MVVQLIKKRNCPDEIQFGFVSMKGTTDAFHLVQQLQEKYLDTSKLLYLAFIKLLKAFDGVFCSGSISSEQMTC